MLDDAKTESLEPDSICLWIANPNVYGNVLSNTILDVILLLSTLGSN